MGHVANAGAGIAIGKRKDGDVARRGLAQPGNHAQQRGLPGSVLAAKNIKFASLQFDGDVSYGCSATVDFRDVVNLDGQSVSSQRQTSVSFALGLLHGGGACLLRRVLRRALGLKLFGVEHPVGSKISDGKRLGVVLERVRRRF